jgi:cupin fold WbuC family metalloprotein
MILDNDYYYRHEKNARTFTVFANCLSLNSITNEVLTDLEKRALSLGTNARICMHEKNSPFTSEMIIAQHRHYYFPPKLRLDSNVSFTVLSGILGIYIFDLHGTLLDYSIVDGKNSFYSRVQKGIYHVDIPITPLSIHLEIVSCTTKNLSDLVHPLWYRPENRLEFLNTLPTK